MLTCKVGKTIVDTFTYEESRLREWSNKGMLKCPACGEKMLYCHGDFKIPYFRHEKNSDCPDIFSEGVTQEHMQGIKILYDWLSNQEGINNLQLEKWIPETRQRPDIYFIKYNQEYAIEFQCSPISTQYNKRHNLYRLQKIKDIWILGVEKYSIKKYEKILSLELFEVEFSDMRLKTIEVEINNSDNSLLYLNSTGNLIKSIKKLKPISGYKTKYDNLIDDKKIETCYFDNIISQGNLYDENNPFKIISNIIKNKIKELNTKTFSNSYRFITYMSNKKFHMAIRVYNKGSVYETTINDFSENKLNEFVDNEIIKEKKKIEDNKKRLEQIKQKTEKCDLLTEQFKIVNKNCEFEYGSGNYGLYLWKIIFTCDVFERTFFIKENQTDCTERCGYYINLDSYKYRELNINKVFEYISKNISNTLRKERYGR